jgi:hypothetical protein
MIGLGIDLALRPPAIFDPALAALSTAAVWIDPSNAGSLLQEITGAAATTPAAVGDPVGSIRNLGAGGGWLTAPSNAARAVRQAPAGYPSLTHDGVDDWYNITATTATEWTMLAVFNRQPGTHQPLFNSAAVDTVISHYHSVNVALARFSGSIAGGGGGWSIGSVSGRQCFGGLLSGTLFEHRRAGAARFSGTVTSATQTISRVSRGASGNSTMFTGELHEAALWPRALSAAELAAVEAYMIAKWGAATT